METCKSCGKKIESFDDLLNDWNMFHDHYYHKKCWNNPGREVYIGSQKIMNIIYGYHD